jgi:hypothetical protein
MAPFESLLEHLRTNRLKSYQATPGDIEEHRRAELRVAGDTAGRPLIELIQNADDAMNQYSDYKENKVRIILQNNRFVIANSGDPFTDLGVEAICNLDRSPKKDRRVTIGNKGIGFKSALTWSAKPIIYSKTIDFTFDREQSAKEIGRALDEDFRPESVPLMRLPFRPIQRDNLAEKLYQEGFVTSIILQLKNEGVAKSVFDELDNFDPLTLLFLNSISDLLILTEDFKRQYRVFREKHEIIIHVDDKQESYRIFRDEKKIPDHICSSMPEDCQDLTHSVISIAIPDKPIERYYELFSNFPTSERCPFKFFIHGDFILDAGRRHLRNDAKQYNEWVIKKIAYLFENAVLPFFGKTNPTVIDFLECRSPKEMETVEKKIFDIFVEVIGSSNFLPALLNPSRLVSPHLACLARVETLNDICGLFENEIEWQERFFIEPEWSSKTRLETLIKFGCKEIKKPDFVKILGTLSRPDPGWCTDALNIILKWKEDAPPWYSSDNESARDIANSLKHQPLFLTTKFELRSLHSSIDEAPPLFLPSAEGKIISIPSFVSLDFLNPEIGKDLEKQQLQDFRKRLNELDEYGLHPFKPREIIEKAILPAIKNTEHSAKWVFDHRVDLLIFLAELEPNENKFEDTVPYPWLDDLRSQLALYVYVPAGNGDWLPAWKVYASKEWDAHDELTKVYEGSPDREFLAPPNNDIHSGISNDKWKTLYRYLGVSWEPKILPIEMPPSYITQYSFPNPHPSNVSVEDWDQYKLYFSNDNNLQDMWGWSIELKDSYILDDWERIRKDAEKCINLLRLFYKTEIFNFIAGSQKAKVKCSFRYRKVSRSYSSSCYSFLLWGIRYLDWLPSKSGKILPPKRIYLEDSEVGKNLNGIVPILQIKRPKEKELGRRFEDLLDELGIRTNWDQITIDDWRNWLNDLSEITGEISNQHVRAAQTLYRHCLEQFDVSGYTTPFSDINVLSVSSVSNYSFKKAEEVTYIDESRFDTIKMKLMDSGHALFVLELGGENRAKKAKDIFGMTLASEMVNEEVIRGEEVFVETEEWRNRFDRVSPVLFARLRKDRPERRTKDENFFRSLRLSVVKNLKKRFKLLGTGALLFEESPPACWSNSDNTIYLNPGSAERSLLSGLAEALAQRLGQMYYEAFDTILLCESDSERIDKLRKAGVPEDDILDCERMLKEELGGFQVEGVGELKGDDLEGRKTVEEEPNAVGITEGPGEVPVGEQILEASEGEFGEGFKKETGIEVTSIEQVPDMDKIDHDVHQAKIDRGPTTKKEVSKEKKDKVELAAIGWVERYEKDHNREPKDVSQYNMGYDIESSDPLTGKTRYIEVKGASGRPEKRGFTINEWRKAIELGEQYYIYYALGLGDTEGELRIINDPANKISPDEKAYDVKLSKDLADEIYPLKKKTNKVD